MHATLLGLGLLVGTVSPSTAPTSSPVASDAHVVLADFQAGLPDGVALTDADGRVVTEQARRYLRLTVRPRTPAPTVLRFALPAAPQTAAATRVTLRLRLTPETAPEGATAPATRPGVPVLRLVAGDGRGALLQRRLAPPAPGEWVDVGEPLSGFRWAADRGGLWREATWLALVLEGDARTLDVDDVELRAVPDEPPALDPATLARLAFPAGTRHRIRVEGELLAGVDLDDDRVPDDLARMLDDLRSAEAWVERVFGDVARPAEGPLALLAFTTPDARAEFLRRLGDHWRVSVAPPTAQGYTVLTLATGLWDPRTRSRRPLLVHEAVHAAIARRLLIPSGTRHAGWFHEGLASYVQLARHPGTIHRDFLPSEFARAARDIASGRFVPLRTLMTEPTAEARYAQAATVVAFLMDRHPDLLRAVARTLADGRPATDTPGLDLDALQRDWLTWGTATFNAPRDRTFPPLPEFRD